MGTQYLLSKKKEGKNKEVVGEGKACRKKTKGLLRIDVNKDLGQQLLTGLEMIQVQMKQESKDMQREITKAKERHWSIICCV